MPHFLLVIGAVAVLVNLAIGLTAPEPGEDPAWARPCSRRTMLHRLGLVLIAPISVPVRLIGRARFRARARAGGSAAVLLVDQPRPLGRPVRSHRPGFDDQFIRSSECSDATPTLIRLVHPEHRS